MERTKDLASYSSPVSSRSSTISLPSRSSAPFPSEFFGLEETKTTPSSPGNAFASIFPLPAKVRVNERKHHPAAAEVWTIRTGNSGSSQNESKRKKGETRGERKWDDASYIYREQALLPLNLSSSIFYGGQETYPRPHDDHDHASKPVSSKNDNREDDSGSASRGDWWQGSLYY